MVYYISGGCKNGKSMLAQNLAKKLAGEAPLYYVATMIPHDKEDEARIARHLKEREGWGFHTLEQGTDICGCLSLADRNGTFMLDSITALVSNEMFAPDGFHADAGEKVAEELQRFIQNVENTVLVSDFIFSDAERYDGWTESYRRALALVDRTALLCDGVIEVCAGTYTIHKGRLPI